MNLLHVLLLLSIINVSFTYNCTQIKEKDDECECLITPPNEFEIGCPPNNQDVKVDVTFDQETTVSVQCTLNGSHWDMNKFPKLHLGAVKSLRFNFCPRPFKFIDILKRFDISKLEILNFYEMEEDNSSDFNVELFEGLDLQKLFLPNNKLKNIKGDLLKHLNNLKALNFNNNEIASLHPDTFKHTLNLEELELIINKLSTLDESIFHPLKRLRSLNLFHNELKELPTRLFEENLKLRILDLSYNPLISLNEDLFKNNPNLVLISLRGTMLNNLPSNLFKKTALETLHLDKNYNITLPENLIRNLTTLKQVTLCECNLNIIPKDFFTGCLNLERLSLSSNQLNVLHLNTFEDLEKLKQLDISKNHLRELPHVLFHNLRHLEKLNLGNNEIEGVSEGLFEKLDKLKELDMSNNHIKFIRTRTFSKLRNLKIIDLSHNLLVLDNFPSLLNSCVNLREVDFSYNNIEYIDNDNFLAFTDLQRLDLSNNNISEISRYDFQFVSENIDINLQNNNISKINFTNYINLEAEQQQLDDHKLYLTGNPIICDCELYDFVKYVQESKVKSLRINDVLYCDGPNDLKNVSIDDIHLDQLICPVEEQCPKYCDCFWRRHDKTIIVDCSYKNLTEPPYLTFKGQNVSLEVNLVGNQLMEPPTKYHGYDNVTQLYLAENHIKELSWLPPKLQKLTLSNNKLQTMDYEILRQLNHTTGLKFLSLDNNPWICNCSTTNFTDYLRRHSAIQRINVKNVTCTDGKLLVNLNAKDLCKNFLQLYLIWILIFLILLVIIFGLAAFYYRYQQEIKVWLYAHNMLLWFVTEEELDKDKEYDAFVSYAHQDEDFVANELLPTLENGPEAHKLCLHYRNWIGGELIMTQIVQSVEQSRRTIVVLSEHFLKSIWGKMEFRTAHQKALSEGRARVIIIIYGDVNPEDIIDEELKAYLKTHTYIRWGDKWFWYKLKYAMPHSHCKRKKKRMENLFNKIDKLDLITNGLNTPNIGSTPPVEITLDPLLLKGVQKVDNGLLGDSTPVEENNRQI